jgi:hypothetical protein
MAKGDKFSRTAATDHGYNHQIADRCWLVVPRYAKIEI